MKINAGTTFFFSAFNCQISDVLSTKRKSRWKINKFIVVGVQEMDINICFEMIYYLSDFPCLTRNPSAIYF